MQSVLVIQTARSEYIDRAMKDILNKGLLGPCRICMFCRGLAEEQADFQGLSWIDEWAVHHETKGALGHLLELRKRNFDVVIAFFTRDPSYWKAKLFVFLLRGRHLLIFNEHLGCFYYTHRAFFSFLCSRYRDWKLRCRQRIGYSLGTSQGYVSRSQSMGMRLVRPLHLMAKLLLFPIRFFYLLAWSRSMERRRKRTLDSGAFLFGKEEML